MNLLLLPNHTLFVCDTYVNEEPSAEMLAGCAVILLGTALATGVLRLQAHNPEQDEAEEELELEYGGEATTIGFNVSYAIPNRSAMR